MLDPGLRVYNAIPTVPPYYLMVSIYCICTHKTLDSPTQGLGFRVLGF